MNNWHDCWKFPVLVLTVFSFLVYFLIARLRYRWLNTRGKEKEMKCSGEIPRCFGQLIGDSGTDTEINRFGGEIATY